MITYTIYTFTLCFGVWMPFCGASTMHSFPTMEACERERLRLERISPGAQTICAQKVTGTGKP